MPSQLFKQNVPFDTFFEFLKKICTHTNDSYVLDNAAYKRGNMHGYVQEFFEKIKQYYHTAKRVYVDRKQSYTTFMTIIRQICKSHNVPYSSKIAYSKSKYEIIYYISTPTQPD